MVCVMQPLGTLSVRGLAASWAEGAVAIRLHTRVYTCRVAPKLWYGLERPNSAALCSTWFSILAHLCSEHGGVEAATTAPAPQLVNDLCRFHLMELAVVHGRYSAAGLCTEKGERC